MTETSDLGWLLSPVMVSRKIVEDKRISAKAKGVLLYLLSFPNGCSISREKVKEGLGVGAAGLTSAVNELVGAGYIKRHRRRGADGKVQPYEYEILA